jgi:hypothetical protein
LAVFCLVEATGVFAVVPTLEPRCSCVGCATDCVASGTEATLAVVVGVSFCVVLQPAKATAATKAPIDNPLLLKQFRDVCIFAVL